MHRIAFIILFFAGCSAETTVELPAVDTGDVPDVVATPDVTMPDYVEGVEALDYVNPFIGTGGAGFAYASMTPAVQAPLGFVKVGPDTTDAGSHPSEFHHFSGYYWRDPDIRGFSHLHFVGTGAADYGNLRFAIGDETKLDRLPQRWWTEKNPGSEDAEPGYYSVSLADGSTAEMTATTHGAIHRYQLPAGAIVAIDPTSSVKDSGVIDSEVAINGDLVEGRFVYAGSYVGRGRPFELFFTIKLSGTPDDAWVWNDEGYQRDQTAASGVSTGALIQFAERRTLKMHVGVSLISMERAREHRADIDDQTLEEVRLQTRAEWAELLDRVQLPQQTDETELRLFYTALYNCFRMPTRLDEKGEYRGHDGEVHPVDHMYVTDLSLWDTYRTLHPLWTIVAPDLQRDVLRSLLLMARDGGYIARWPAAISYTSGMEGDSGAILFAEGATKGIDGVDYAAAFDHLLDTADAAPPEGAPYGGREGIESYLELGWVAADEASGSASNTLEYAIDDNALAELAAHLGRTDDEARFRDRATWYRNVWDDETKFFRPRNRDGSFVEGFASRLFQGRSGDYTEGTAWHWRFYVPHDARGMIGLFDGPDPFEAELETFMSESRLWQGDPGLLVLPDPFYWHTNQPPLHVPFLYAALGEWERMEYWVDRILTNAYFDRPDGLVGNDDGGTLSSWYILAKLGIYPVVGTDQWIVFDPDYDGALLFDQPLRWVEEHHRYASHAELFE